MNIESIKQKIKIITESLLEIDPILKFSTNEIVHDSLKLRSAERLFQLIVDAAIDINTEIIASNSLESPDSLQKTFYVLEATKIFSGDFLDKIAMSVGLRNRLVHRYETIKPQISTDQIKKYIFYYIEYIKIINIYINNI